MAPHKSHLLNTEARQCLATNPKGDDMTYVTPTRCEIQFAVCRLSQACYLFIIVERWTLFSVALWVILSNSFCFSRLWMTLCFYVLFLLTRYKQFDVIGLVFFTYSSSPLISFHSFDISLSVIKCTQLHLPLEHMLQACPLPVNKIAKISGQPWWHGLYLWLYP